MLTWVIALFMSGGRLKVSTLPLARSYLPIAPWYIMPNQMLPSLSAWMLSEPCGQPSLSSGSGISVTLPVFGSILPMFCSPKFV